MFRNLFNSTIIILIINFISFDVKSEIKNYIVVKVGNSVVTSSDIMNEIITNLIIEKKEITQVNIDNGKNYAVKNLIIRSIKNNEITKYEIVAYSKEELQRYIASTAKILNTNSIGFKEIFKKKNISYDLFVERHKTELLWNTLIYAVYKNQINVNIIEVENEARKLLNTMSKENQNADEFAKIKKKILQKRKQEKLSLFSRSHISNLENTVRIKFR